MADRLDMLILGATGFTGMYCIPYAYKLSKADGRDLTWGVAGRSENKLKDVLLKMGKKIGADLSKVPIIICDITDRESLVKMAQSTKIVLNCCGPYQFLGEAVVKACIESGTHHVDVSGEPQYMEGIALEQNQAAKDKGVYVISACGMDSIPADMGIIYLRKQFQGVLNSTVIYLEVWDEGSTGVGSAVNFGTWESAVHAVGAYRTLASLRRKLYPEKLPIFIPKLKSHNYPQKSSVVDGWSLPFPGIDRDVVKRSQRYFYENEFQRPIQVDTKFVVKSFMSVIGIIISAGIFAVLSQFSLGRKLLLRYPGFFSWGVFSKENPTEDRIEKTWAQLTFYGEGWTENSHDRDIPPNKAIIGRIKGRNPVYGITCVCLVGAAVMIAMEKDKLPNNGQGGVYTPGVAFANTSLVNLLNENGVSFNIIAHKDIK